MLGSKIAVGLLLSIVVAGCYAPQAGSNIPSYDGARLYRDHCASCHGQRGAGDGPIAASLKIPPSDLRLLAARNDGVFPRFDVIREIDGRADRAVHGPRDMPVWGWRFSRGDNDLRDPADQTEARLEALVDFLERLQTPAG